jgi:hypothetical protein
VVGTSKSLRFWGSIQGHEVLVLVDSGSSNSFINTKFISLLSGISQLSHPIKVQVANGHVLYCAAELSQAKWSIQGVDFVFDLKILPLPFYDVIVGMDWFESNSPMRVDWLNKWIVINQARLSVQLHGILPSIPECSVIELFLVQDSLTETVVFVPEELPAPVQQLLQSFGHLFEESHEVTPSRAHDHSIPLIEGAQPVNVKPYCFSPVMKDEVEKQVTKMTHQGLIQLSKS